VGVKCLVAIVVAVVLVPTSLADARKRRDPCRPKHSTTLFANDTIRLFDVPKGDDGKSEYVCSWASRRRFFLTHSDAAEDVNEVRNFETSGRFFLYVTYTCTKEFCNYGEVGLIDLRAGTRRRPSLPDPSEIALTDTGTVVYTTDPPVSSLPNPPGVYVLARSASQPEPLDAGDDLDPRSLALAGHTVYWTRGGQPHSARVP
jgi:hypothetical protein